MTSVTLIALVAGSVAVILGIGQPSPDPTSEDGPGAGERHSTASADGQEVFRGDFSTGDLSQWDGFQRVAPDRVRVVREPGPMGPLAARFEVRQGDNPVGRDDRAEVQRATGDAEGVERVYRWSMMLGHGFPVTPEWQVVTQWHVDGREGSPSVAFYVQDGQLQLQVRRFDRSGNPIEHPRVVWSGPAKGGVWRSFRLRVGWSGDDAHGYLRLWVDGVDETGTIRVRTLYPGRGAYLKQGYYRSRVIAPTGIVFHQGMVVETI